MKLFAGCFRPSHFVVFLAIFTISMSPSSAFEIFVHETTSTNTFLNVTQLDQPLLNDNPNAKPIIQQVLDQSEPGGVDQATYFGVAYSLSSGRWSIETQDLSVPMTVGIKFFVFPSSAYTHDNSAGNVVGDETVIDTGNSNGRDIGFWMTTYFRTRTGSSGPRNPHPTAMRYDLPTERWRGVNQDDASMPTSGGFFVFGVAVASGALSDGTSPNSSSTVEVLRGGRHEVTGANTPLPEMTLLNFAELNGRPEAVVLATVDASDDIYNPHPVAVTYDPLFDRWVIYNIDGAALSIGGTFMLWYGLYSNIFSDDFESGDTTAWSTKVN